MTYGILLRKEWEDNSAKMIMDNMKSKVVVRRSGEQWPDGLKGVFRWGCTANIPTDNVFNSASAIHLAADKPKFRKVLVEKTTVAPITWFHDSSMKDLFDMSKHLPVVVRPNKHDRGKDFHVCATLDEVVAATDKFPEYYISKFYNKAREFRVMMVQKRVAFVVEKTPKNKTLNSWGLAAGWENILWGSWPLEVVKAATEAFKLSKLTFGAADVILDTKGGIYVCEVNTAPELPKEYEAVKIATCFDYIINNDKKDLPVGGDGSNWKHYIHPSLSEKAIL